MGRSTLRSNALGTSAVRAVAATGVLAVLGCTGGDTNRSAQDFAGLWQATSASLQLVCDGVQTTPSFAPYLVSLQADGDGRLTRMSVDASGAASEPCTWQYVIKGGRAVLDGKQTCAVVQGTVVSTTVWSEDALTLSEDLQTLEQKGTFSDAIACTTTADVVHTRQASPGAGGAGGLSSGG